MEWNGEKIQAYTEDGPIVRLPDFVHDGAEHEVYNPCCTGLYEIGSFGQYCMGRYSCEWLECLGMGIAEGRIPIGKRLPFETGAARFLMTSAYVERVEFSRLDRSRFYMDAIIPVKIRISAYENGFERVKIVGQWYRLRTLVEIYPHGFGTELYGIMVYDKRDSDPGLPLSKYLVPVLSMEDIEREAEAMLRQYYPEAILRPTAVNGEVLAERMGLTVLDVPLPLEQKLMGQSIFCDCVIKIDQPGRDTLTVKANTILVNSRMGMSQSQRNTTIIHECCHQYEHDLFIWGQQQYQDGICGIDCPVDASLSGKDSPLFWVERQARIMSYCVQMNRAQLRPLVSNLKAEHEWEWLICKIANQFHVSKECAKYRLADVGFDEVRGVLDYINSSYQPSYFFENGVPGRKQTFSVGLREAAREFGRNKAFRTAIGSGKYVYVEGKLCLNHGHYIRKKADGGLRMTAQARKQVDRCCLRFDVICGAQSDPYTFGRLNRKNQSNSIPHTVFPQTGQAEASGEPETFVAIAQWATAVNKNTAAMDFSETLSYLMRERRMTIEALEESSQISARTIRRLRSDPDYAVTREQIVALAVGLELPPVVSVTLLGKAGLSMKNTELHNIYSMILYTMYPAGIQAVNAILAAQNVPPLSSHAAAS